MDGRTSTPERTGARAGREAIYIVITAISGSDRTRRRYDDLMTRRELQHFSPATTMRFTSTLLTMFPPYGKGIK